MILNSWVVSVYDGGATDRKCWYLPFLVTKQEKPVVVIDEAAIFDGTAINDAVFLGINLRNGRCRFDSVSRVALVWPFLARAFCRLVYLRI